MNKPRTLLTVIVALLAGMVGAAPNRAFDFYASNLIALESKSVQKDIGVNAAQLKRMNDFANAERPQRTAIMQQFQKEAQEAQKAGRPYQADYNKIKPLDIALKQNVLGILTDAQLRRLREITIQGSGLVALLDERVAKETGLPSATVAKLRATFTSSAKQANDIRQAEQKKLFDEYSKKKPKDAADAKRLQDEAIKRFQRDTAPTLQRIQQQTKAKMEGMLTSAQKAAFEALKGKPFKP